MATDDRLLRFSARAQHCGIHWHVTLWAGRGGTLGCSGKLRFRDDEWPPFREALKRELGAKVEEIVVSAGSGEVAP